jgi:serine/threonine-protein kinase RIO1
VMALDNQTKVWYNVIMSEKLPPIGNRTFYLKGFTITRKMEFEGAKSEFTDILREIADVLDEMELTGADISTFNLMNNDKLKFNVQMLEKK